MCARPAKDRLGKVKAIILLSGGLDSTLAAHIVREQGLKLFALNFTGPFCLCQNKGGCHYTIKDIAQRLNIEFETLDNTKQILECVKNPKYGYGSNMNPCIDCRIVMLRKTKEYMQKLGASFVITGEVVGQRPMSQRRHILRLIEQEAGLEGLILRPLCAKSLPMTIPEKEGWVDREKLLNIVGRSRKEQIEIAKELMINDYPCPSGGCLLTDPNFARRLKDLMKFNPKFSLNDILLLKLGRHFRLEPDCKLIVGRNERENNSLINLKVDSDLMFMPQDYVAGPSAIGRGRFNNGSKELACSILSRYCDKGDESAIKIYVQANVNYKHEIFNSRSLSQEELLQLII